MFRSTLCGLAAMAFLFLNPPVAAAQRCGDALQDDVQLATAWQAIEDRCGCGNAPAQSWKASYRDFIACARQVAREAEQSGSLRRKCRGTVLASARHSTCARPQSWATCCFVKKQGQKSCKVRKTAADCRSTKSRFAALGAGPTCLDACDDVSGPACWTDSQCNDGDDCTGDLCEPSEGCRHIEIEGCAQGPTGSSCSGTGSSTHGLSAAESALFQLMNQYRARKGLSPVKLCRSLSRASQDHANDMRDQRYFSHVGRDGSQFWERACDAGYRPGCGPATAMGEVLGSTYSAPNAALNQWLNSSGHESIISSSHFAVAGIGHACGGSLANYWAMNFAGVDHSSCD